MPATAPYPTLAQVESASLTDLVRWQRFLPSPIDENQRAAIERVGRRIAAQRANDPAAFTAASKTVGYRA